MKSFRTWEEFSKLAKSEYKNANRRYWKIFKTIDLDPLKDASDLVPSDDVVAEQLRLADKYAEKKWQFWSGARSVPEIMFNKAYHWLADLGERCNHAE